MAASKPSPAGTRKQASQDPAEVIFYNGDIYLGVETHDGKTFRFEVNEAMGRVVSHPGYETTVVGQPAGPGETVVVPGHRAQAIAVRGGRVVALGSDTEVRRLAGPHTELVDLHGRFVMPGFNDAHVHLANAGFEKLNVDLVGAKSLEEMLARIAERAKSTPKGEWLVGRGWDHTLWKDPKLPSRQDLDAVTGDHPAIFTRVDGHISVANTAALRWAGITRATPDPQGGKIDHDAAGEPTGILRETVKDDLLARLPKPSRAQRKRALELALQDAAQHGLTSVQDNSNWDDFLAMEELEREGKLPIRVCEWLRFDLPLEEL
ncbi:MAG TPA: amidohydrolase family protein, partial [Terriglobales bacterium]|nr:amidohydrolase family protein [Terriglobales bacterium]